MKLDKLRFLQEEFKKELAMEAVDYCLYYDFNNNWHVLDSSRSLTDVEIICINSAIHEPVAFHKPNEKIAWFSIADLQCVVSMEFKSSPKLAKRKVYRQHIVRVQERAENSFKVSHNPLTLLLARDAFYERVFNLLQVVNAPQKLEGEGQEKNEGQENGLPQILAVLALDIDYFKQVNDTYGHIYGDQVLKSFATRLEQVAADIQVNDSRVTIGVGHPSGEEFLICIAGNCSSEEILSWANQFRARIADEILPTEKEWGDLSNKDDLSMILLPPQQERGVKTSIGGVIHSRIALPPTGTDEVKFLLDRADTALYRAKSAGRNQVIMFESILESCGRVLEQDRNTRVIAIDIGANVGVLIGQEFAVYSPDFNGKKKFLINDGRTTRTIGVYPKVELTRITVFNVQPEMAFAFLSDPSEHFIDVEVGSELESIPVGSIGHIVPYGSKFFIAGKNSSAINDLGSLRAFIKDEAGNNKKLFAVVFRFSRDHDYIRKYGAAALSIALKQLYRNVLGGFASLSQIAVLDQSSLCLVGLQGAYKEECVIRVVDDFCSDFPELGVVAGVFCNADIKGQSKDVGSKLDEKYALEFAQFAASLYGRLAGEKVTHFDSATAYRILSSQRDARAYASAQADFEKMKEMGVANPRLLNLGGVIYGALGLRMLATEHYEMAMAQDQNVLMYKSNFAHSLKLLGESEKSLKIYNTFSDENIKTLLKTHISGMFAYAILLAKAKSRIDSPHFDLRRFNLIAKSALEWTKYKESSPNEYELLKTTYECS